MIKHLLTLIKGAVHQADEDLSDRHALLILRQQMNECAQAVATAKKAVAIAIAQNRQEEQQHERMSARITDLETRTLDAMQKGQNKLAREAAETIARLETEQASSREALDRFDIEISRLQGIVDATGSRLKNLERGQRIALATDRTQRLREAVPTGGLASMAEAEKTLARLQHRQQQIDLTCEAIDAMEDASNPAKIIEKLAAAQCGKPLRSSADDVLERLGNSLSKAS